MKNNSDKKKIKKDILILSKFTEAFCAGNHNFSEKNLINLSGPLGEIFNKLEIMLCKDCKNVLLHGAEKRLLCPYHPKPPCKKCPTMCYRNGYREKMKEIMKFSGLYFIKKGKLNYIFKYFF